MFYLTKPISEGPPTEDCAESVIHAMKGKASVALLSLIGMLAFWWAALSALPNCCGSKKNDPKLIGKHIELSEDISGMNTTMNNTTRDQTMLKWYWIIILLVLAIFVNK